MDEIKIKKENVLMLHQRFIENRDHVRAEELAILFPEAFEEEKKESELYDFIFTFCGDYTEEDRKDSKEQDWHSLRMCLKQKIIDLAKSKVDKCKGLYNHNEVVSKNEIKQKLDEM